MYTGINSLKRILLQEHVFMVIVACATGYTVGICVVLFKWMIRTVRVLFYSNFFAGLPAELSFSMLWIPVMVGLGGLLVGLMNHYLNPDKNSGSVSEPMKWAAIDQGNAPYREIWFRPIASAITIGSGGSAGREGPSVVIGAAIGSLVGGIIKASSERRRMILGCGSAAGMAAAFNAPLGGIIFAIEVILGDFNVNVFSPLIFSSVIATATARHLEGDTPAFSLPVYTLVSNVEIFFFVLLGVAGGLVAALFYKAYFYCGDYFKEKKLHPVAMPLVGGVVVGFIGIIFPDALSNGYESMNKVINGQMLWTLALSLIFVKIITTSITLGSGGSGGMYAPALFIGSMLGGVFGTGLHNFFPAYTGSGGSYAIVGMGAVMAVVGQMPLTNIIMTFELTNNYHIILPIMVACISSIATYSAFYSNSIYTEKLRRMGITLWHGRESAVMASIKVEDVMQRQFETIPENTKFREVVEYMAKSKSYYFPCVDAGGAMTGIISVQDIRELMLDKELADVVVAKDLTTHKVITLLPEENLNDAMEKFSIKDLDELPVISGGDNKVIGMLKRKDAISAYKKATAKASGTRHE